jgi:Flp pilus assembly pilin Flp
MKLIYSIIKQNEGAGLAEYSLLLLLIALACIATVTLLGISLSEFFNEAGQLLFGNG